MSDESLFREVDEEVRRQQLEQLWKRYGNLAVAVSVVVIAGVAGLKGWQYFEERRAESAGAAYFAALKLTPGEDASRMAEELAAVAAGRSGFAVLARLQQAGTLARTGKLEDAVKLYDALAADAGVDANLRNLARIKAALLLVDTAPLDEIESRLKSMDDPNSVWRNPAREILSLAAFRVKDYETTDRLMSEVLADPEAPAGMRQRAEMMISLVAPRLGKAKAAP